MNVMNLPEPLYRAAQVRELDRRAIEMHGIPGATLMQRAGEAVFNLLRTRWPRARNIAIVCGPGNNGGDGYVVARLAQAEGLTPTLLYIGDAPKGDAAAMRLACEAAGLKPAAFDAQRLAQSDTVIDALLGTGLERDVTGLWRTAIEAINRSGLPVLAVDVPSGLHADTGRVMGAAVRAQATLSFIGLKPGLFTAEGPAHAGDIYFDDLGVPPAVFEGSAPFARRITPDNLRGLLAPRRRSAHKGSFGHVLVVGGDRGMPGAVRLAGEAALRTGVGLVTLATHTVHAPGVNADRPELIVVGVNGAADLAPLLARARVVAIGPGLQRNSWGGKLFTAALDAHRPLVVDADALHWLAQEPARYDSWVLTPHPGEASSLIGSTTEAVQADRFAAARAIADKFGGVCVLKGAGTVVCSAGDVTFDVCDAGNPGMATAGMGDVLTGVIAALLAQGLAPRDAARLGVWLHARAGDDAAAHGGEIGLLASDLFTPLRALVNQLTQA
ncbi:MAG: NAD(P)H-hydrate dehydratase [Pseudomonadota bacterium]